MVNSSVIVILVIVASFTMQAHPKGVTKNKYFSVSTSSTKPKNDGSMGYILFPGVLPWIPVPIRARPVTSTAVTTTVTPSTTTTTTSTSSTTTTTPTTTTASTTTTRTPLPPSHGSCRSQRQV